MNRYSSGPQTRSRSRLRSRLRSNGSESINRPRSAKRARPASANRPRSANANRPRSASRNRPRSASRNRPRSESRPRSASRNRPRIAAAEEPQRLEIQGEQNTQPYSQEELSLDLRPPFVRANSAHLEPQPLSAGANSAHLEPQPLERRLSAAERHRLAQRSGSDLILQEVSENEYFSAEENSPPNSQYLQRFKSVTNHQSPLRFVLYTSDLELSIRFAQHPPIPIFHNSNQLAPLTAVFLNRNSGPERRQIRSRLPKSVKYLSDDFTEGQFKNSLTLDHYFLLTIERDTRDHERDDRPSEPPTGEIYGVLCCSEETATRNSADFVDSAGARLINFDTFNGTPYIYVHLFTFLSDKTVGYDFFTGSFMLEGLYKLFNPREQNERIIYLEAITVPATIQFYDRFGMERLIQMEINGTLYYFDPFKGFVVPDEIPYVLYRESQIRDAAIASERTRRARQAQLAERVQASIPSGLPVVTNAQRKSVENSVFKFGLLNKRSDPRGRK